MKNKKNLSLYCLDCSGTLLDAAQAINKNKSRSALVIEENKVIGLISEGDLVRALLNGMDIHTPVTQFVHYGFAYLHQRNLVKALEIFKELGFSLIPVLSKKMELKDVITAIDVLKHMKIDNPEI